MTDNMDEIWGAQEEEELSMDQVDETMIVIGLDDLDSIRHIKNMVDILESKAPVLRNRDTESMLNSLRTQISNKTCDDMFYHKTENGRKMLIEDMTDNHLLNTIRMWVETAMVKPTRRSIHRTEISRRDKVRVFAKLQPYLVEYCLRNFGKDPVINSILKMIQD